MPETRATNPQEPRDEDFPTSIASAKDAAIFETFVVPRYLSLFAEPLVEKIVSSRDARVCHAQCRTGYPDRQLLQKLPNAHVYGCDDSTFAVELARAKAAAEPGNVSDYRVVRDASLPFPSGAFSHALAVHPRMHVAARLRLFEELARILAPFGQALIALPLRGSFVELSDSSASTRRVRSPRRSRPPWRRRPRRAPRRLRVSKSSNA